MGTIHDNAFEEIANPIALPIVTVFIPHLVVVPPPLP
jgi:hypothetical protein